MLAIYPQQSMEGVLKDTISKLSDSYAKYDRDMAESLRKIEELNAAHASLKHELEMKEREIARDQSESEAGNKVKRALLELTDKVVNREEKFKTRNRLR